MLNKLSVFSFFFETADQKLIDLLSKLPGEVERDSTEVGVAKEVVQVVGEQLENLEKNKINFLVKAGIGAIKSY